MSLKVESYMNDCMSYPRKNVWVVIDPSTGEKIGEVAAMSSTEARAIVKDHVSIPFRLSHIEE
jgi:hypothetical protein